jgi:hypothetical protein
MPILLPSKSIFDLPINPGRQLIDGEVINGLLGSLGSNATGLVAKAGGTIVGATPINVAMADFTVCATASDSSILPSAYPGLTIYVTNRGAAAMQIFGTGSDTIQGTAGATGVALASGATAQFTCVVAGAWKRFLSA